MPTSEKLESLSKRKRIKQFSIKCKRFLKRRDDVMTENIRFGCAPIAWTNDDLPELGKENTF
ncbi:Uncharacterised protein [Staphylococcus gallinarum]|uniref:Uncharacterized protein n=1 Tax=Staphylococcus gallinarum TaxID=1293 RepID=A0A380FA93_STAGA|nr:Uncharacterised protein [Staphylococcus gallinarum]